MPNNKIARIVANIEYRQPAGALEEYKYGVKIKRQVAPVQGESNPDIIRPNFRDLKQELSRAPKTIKIPDADLVGENG